MLEQRLADRDVLGLTLAPQRHDELSTGQEFLDHDGPGGLRTRTRQLGGVLADRVMVDARRAVLIRGLDDAGESARVRHGHAGPGQHRGDAILAPAESQRLAA